MSHPTNELFVFGGGTVGLVTAMQIQRLAYHEGKDIKVVVLTPEIHACTQSGNHAVFGIDGFFMERHFPKNGKTVLKLVRSAYDDLEETLRQEAIDCRFDRGYQFLGKNRAEVMQAVHFVAKFAGYKKGDFQVVKKTDRLGLKGLPYAMQTDVIGQVSTPELQQGLLRLITKYGGEIRLGDSYMGHSKTSNGYEIDLLSGEQLISAYRPFLALGYQMAQVPGIRPVFPEYTAAIHIQISAEDAHSISPKGPMAFCDTALAGDVVWGGVDAKNVLTLGFGATKDPLRDRAKMEQAIVDRLKQLRPDIAEKYRDRIEFSFGAMAMTHNQFPIVGRFGDFYASTGFCSRGIVQSWAAGDAIAKHVVLGDNSELKVMREMAGRVRRPPISQRISSQSALHA